MELHIRRVPRCQGERLSETLWGQRGAARGCWGSPQPPANICSSSPNTDSLPAGPQPQIHQLSLPLLKMLCVLALLSQGEQDAPGWQESKAAIHPPRCLWGLVQQATCSFPGPFSAGSRSPVCCFQAQVQGCSCPFAPFPLWVQTPVTRTLACAAFCTHPPWGHTGWLQTSPAGTSPLLLPLHHPRALPKAPLLPPVQPIRLQHWSGQLWGVRLLPWPCKSFSQ